MHEDDLRNREEELRSKRLVAVAVLVVVVLALAVIQFVVSEPGAFNKHYRYEMAYTNDVIGQFELRLPLPMDGELERNITTLGNVTAVIETTSYGRVLRVVGSGNFSAAGLLSTFRDLPIKLSTESKDFQGRDAAWVYFNSTALVGNPHINLTMREDNQSWTTEHFVNGDLVHGWSAIAIREEIEHAR